MNFFLAMAFLFFVGSLVDTGKVWLNDVIILLIIAAVMTVLEYITGCVMLKVMNIRLWDYSK